MRIIRLMPFIFLLLLLGFLAGRVIYKGNTPVISKLLYKKVPKFSLESVLEGEPSYTNKDIESDYKVINFFASWCVSCVTEHEILMHLKHSGVTIYGIDWRDDNRKVRKWLEDRGNPYKNVGTDKDGRVAIDFGISGVPETFVTDRNGTIILHFSGPLNEYSEKQILEVVKDK